MNSTEISKRANKLHSLARITHSQTSPLIREIESLQDAALKAHYAEQLEKDKEQQRQYFRDAIRNAKLMDDKPEVKRLEAILKSL